ncbi:unnamed protein product [Hymenolepis diminuta]|uniref:Peptidase A2 domain-containing protein n=1 Tax=Hymenolepis diminuta TaxID=6216 RepID=A0A0R3SYJ8_HYMDI|nr:unnamed protein product [Hymenolepis diminuta]
MDSIETAKIVAIFQNIIEQMNLSKSDRYPEGYVKNVGGFHYEPPVGEVFATWYARNRDVHVNRMAGLPNETKINMLLRKFNESDHDLYLACLLSLSPKDLTFEETIEKCGKVFDDDTSLFNRCFKCPNLPIREGEDARKYTTLVNRICNAFSYGSLKEDQFSCLVFIRGLRFACYAEIGLKFLIADSNMVEGDETRACQIKKPEIDRSPESNSIPKPQTQQTYPNNPNNKSRYSPFYKHQCQDCNSCGHKEGFCLSSHNQNQHRQAHGIPTTVQVNVSRRRYKTLCIDGTSLDLQVETGSDITIVSNEVWKTLGSSKLDTVPFKVSSASGDAVQLSGVMKCGTTFKGKTTVTVCYVADRDINLLGLDWIDMFNVLEPKVQSVTCSQTSIDCSYENGRGRVGTFRTDGRIATRYIFEMGCPNCSGTKVVRFVDCRPREITVETSSLLRYNINNFQISKIISQNISKACRHFRGINYLSHSP